jgi:hypothetical protein
MFVTKMQQACRDLEAQNNVYRSQLNLLLHNNTQPHAIGQPVMLPLYPFVDMTSMASMSSMPPYLSFPAYSSLWKPGDPPNPSPPSTDSTE